MRVTLQDRAPEYLTQAMQRAHTLFRMSPLHACGKEWWLIQTCWMPASSSAPDLPLSVADPCVMCMNIEAKAFKNGCMG